MLCKLVTQENEEDGSWRITTKYHSIWVNNYYVVLYIYFLCSKLKNCFISTKHAKPYGSWDDSQTTPVQIV